MDEKIPDLESKLDHLLETIYKPGFSTAGHGTTERVAKLILTNGLEARGNDLMSTSVPVISPRKPVEQQDRTKFTDPWPHRGYKCVVIIQVPNPEKGQLGGSLHFNSIFKELPEDRKVDIGVQGADRSYYIPTRFIQGYVNLETMNFTENPDFDPPNQLEVELPPPTRFARAATRAQVKRVDSPPPPTQPKIEDMDADDWTW